MSGKLPLLLLLFSLSIHQSRAQGMAGKDFWVGFMDEDFTCVPNNPLDYWINDTTELYISSAFRATVTVSAKKESPSGSGLLKDTTIILNIVPHKTQRVQMPFNMVVRTFWADYNTNNGIHITADSLITVNAVNRFWGSRGGTAVIPTESIPYAPEYYVTTNHASNPLSCDIGHKTSLSSALLIVGIAPVSKIELIPKGKSLVRDGRPGIPVVIFLKAGETFFYPTGDYDLTGSVVRSRTSASKFAVFAGNRLTFSEQPDSNGVMCKSLPMWINNTDYDHTYEQMIPTVNWGNSYTALPFKYNPGGYYLKIVAAEENTVVSVNGAYVDTLQEGEFHVYNVPREVPARITANKRISVTQFSKGNHCAMHPAPKARMGDVAQMMLPADKQTGLDNAEINFVTAYKVWPTKVADKPESYFNLLVKTADTGQFRINGVKVAQNLWKTSAGMSGMWYVQITADSGVNYALYNPGGVIASTYGYGVKETYAFMASSGFRILQNNFIFDNHCKGDSITYTALAMDSFSNFSWNLNGKSATGTTAKIIYTDTGWVRVAMYFKHTRTNVTDSIVKKLYVNYAGGKQILCNDTIVCGKVDFPLYARHFNQDNTYEWHDGHPNYYKAIKAPGTVWLKVVERNGCHFIDTARIFNFKPPFANFKSWDSSICLNRNRDLLFTNNSTTPDTIVSNTWYFGEDTFVNNSYNFKHRFTTPGTYKLKLVVRSIHGCEDDTIRPLQVSPGPEANFEIMSIDSCLNGNHVTLKNTTVVDSSLHKSFRWFFSEGFFLNNSNPSSPWNYAVPGKYRILLVYDNKYQCVDTMLKHVRIYEHPKTSFVFSKPFECANDSVRLTNTSTSLHNPVLSSWSFGDGSTDTARHTSHLYPAKGMYHLKLVSTTPQGCKDSSNVSLRVYDPPRAAFTVDDTFQCRTGNRFALQDISTTDSGGFTSSQWRYDDSTGDVNRNSVFKSFMYYGIHRIVLKVVNTFGCEDSAIRFVQVKKDPNAWFGINDPSQCFTGHRFDLVYTPLPGNDSIASMTWYYANDSVKDIRTTGGITFPSYGKYPLKLHLRDTDGCHGETVRYAFVNPEPVADISAILPQCFKINRFNFSEQSAIPTGNISTYKWDFGDMTSSVLRSPIDKIYSSSGTYSVVLRIDSDSGCSGSDTALAEVFPNADIQVFQVPDVCLGDSSAFRASAMVNPGSIVSYTWDFGDMGTSQQKDVKHRYTDAGLYSIILSTFTDKGCPDTFRGNNWARVHELPEAKFTYKSIDGGNKNTIIMFEDITQPTPRAWFWDFGGHGNSIRKDTSLSVTDTTTLRARLYVTDNNGCVGLAEKYIFIAPPMPIFFPSAFSPNGDGHNDGFGPSGTMFTTNYTFRIFNRWGEKLFESHIPGELWNGSYQGITCPDGMYYFHVELNDYNGMYKEEDGMFLLMR